MQQKEKAGIPASASWKCAPFEEQKSSPPHKKVGPQRLVALFRCRKDQAASLTCHDVSSRSRFGQRRRPSRNGRKI